MSCLFTPARAAMSTTRAPANPLAENPSKAADSNRRRERAASRSRPSCLGARSRLTRRGETDVPSLLVFIMIDGSSSYQDGRFTREVVLAVLAGALPVRDQIS